MTIHLNGEINGITGQVTAIHEAATALDASPVLNLFGGPINSTTDANGAFRTLEAYYRIEIKPESSSPLALGRSGQVSFRQFSSVGATLWRNFVHIMRREISF